MEDEKREERPTDEELVEKIRDIRGDVGELQQEVDAVREAARGVPTVSWEIVLHESVSFFQPLPGGRMVVKFTQAVPTPGGGLIPVAPAVVIVFGNEGWATFKREVAADGKKAPQIATATVIPPGIQPPR